MSSSKLVKPNSLRLFHCNSVISVVEAAGHHGFLCFAAWLYKFSVWLLLNRGRHDCEKILQGVFQTLSFSVRLLLLFSQIWARLQLISRLHPGPQYFYLSYLLMFWPVVPIKSNQLNIPQWFQLGGHVKFLYSICIHKKVCIVILLIFYIFVLKFRCTYYSL